jgi:hypothetical protein
MMPGVGQGESEKQSHSCARPVWVCQPQGLNMVKSFGINTCSEADRVHDAQKNDFCEWGQHRSTQLSRCSLHGLEIKRCCHINVSEQYPNQARVYCPDVMLHGLETVLGRLTQKCDTAQSAFGIGFQRTPVI